MPSSPWIVLAVAAVVGGYGSAQQVTVRIGGAIQQPAPNANPADADDPGTPVEMFENSNLDRYLRNAQAFLDRQNYEAAIDVLQDVIEERTIEVLAARPEDEGAAGAGDGASKPNDGKPAAGKPAATQPANKPPAADPANPANPANPGGRARPNDRDARNAVYSQDGRIYRPVRRLCHELLARMPADAIELYRAKHEVAAEELLQAALRDGSLTALEQVGNRYFVTLAAGRAMALLGDRLMQEGRYRAAVAVFRDLLETYPAAARQRVGINPVWCRFKIAVCLRQAGEAGSALVAVQELAAASPDESLRVQGELQSVKDLPDSTMFAMATAAATPTVVKTTGDAGTWLAADVDALVPLWQYRFRVPEPYKDPKNSNSGERFFIDGGQATTLMPFAGRYGPGTRVTFGHDAAALGGFPRALFLEHFCLRSADAATGVLLQQGRRSDKDPADEAPIARENQPRVRIASSDFALLRPVEDEARRYVVLGRATAAASVEVLKASELVAFHRELGKPVWSSAQWLDGDAGLRDVTFLAAPVVFGERLLLPALRRGAYSLECLDRRDGRPLWNVPIHAGGSPFFKAPGCQVVVQGGIALVATNAGCLAAVDAFAGDLRWVRRYERVDPQRKSVRKPRRQNDDDPRFGMLQYPQGELTSFLPNDLIVHEGIAVVAPCDGDLLVATDVSTGQMLWYVDAGTHYGPYGRLLTMIGTDGQDVFLVSATHLVAVGLAGGLVKWAVDLPQWNGSQQAGRGRGCLVGEHVVLPGQGHLLVCHTSGNGGVRTLKLPAFDSSREPLAGPFHVTSQGPWLAIGYPGGVEMFSTAPALQQLAARTDEPLAKATLLTQAGDLAAAEAAVVAALRRADGASAHRHELGELLLQLVAARAKELAATDVGKALAAFDGCKELLRERDQLVRWHLARVELCKQIGDLPAHEREQQALYACMEGKS